MKVFLGGTVADSTWRDYMMPKLNVDYFNPVVDDWTEKDQKIEIYEREHCDFCLYVLSPKMLGWYSLAEVIDDSYKKSDKTIYCFLPEDGDKKFTKKQITELTRIGKLARANGAIWKQNLDEVIGFLNSASNLANDFLLQQTDQINNVFISYGRRHSLAFARKLYQSLVDRNYDVWFDMNDIPLGVDFQEQIDDGIRKADNFIYIMSPHSINSVYCYKELVLALKYNKRIIPILHVEPQDDATWGKISPEAGKRNWIYCRQDYDSALEISGKAFEIREKVLNIPHSKWKFTDDYKVAFESLVTLLDSHRAYVRTQTVLLDRSLDWKKDSHSVQKLLTGKGRKEAEHFLERSHQIFKNHTGHLIQPPCHPTDLIAQFVMQSKKNSNNMQSDLFICHDVDDVPIIKKVLSSLAKHRFSAWISSSDILKGEDFGQAIEKGILHSTNILFFISEKSLNSKYCKKEYVFAKKYNKRIIPILIEENPPSYEDAKGYEGLKNIQYINFTDHTDEVNIDVKSHSDVEADVEARREKTPFENSIDEIVHTLSFEHTYYEEYRILLAQAVYWQNHKRKNSYLLRSFNLENAQTWLRLHKERTQNPPIEIQSKFIEVSEKNKALGLDVFLAYSNNNSDITRRIYRELQKANKVTWFGKGNTDNNVSYEKEIYRGIDSSFNFVFITSPDAIASESNKRQLEYAISQNKRIIPVIVKETDELPEALNKPNSIDFINENFAVAFSNLIQAIELDKEHTATHTRVLRKANEWDEFERNPEFLLNTVSCENSEKWLLESYDKEPKGNKGIKEVFANAGKLESKKVPEPSVLQINYIEASRKGLLASALQKRNRRMVVGLMFGVLLIFIIALGFLKFAMYQKSLADNATEKVEIQKEIIKEKTEEVEEITKVLAEELNTSSDSIQSKLDSLKLENEMERNRAKQERLNAIISQEDADKLIAALVPDSLKSEGYSQLWQQAKNDLSKFGYSNSYKKLLLANNAGDMPPEKRDSTNKLLKKVEKLKNLYEKGITHFYKNEFDEAKECFYKVFSINPKDKYSLFYAKASDNIKNNDMLIVKRGNFMMGNPNENFAFSEPERPVHKVILTKYYMGKYEVTNTQYVRFLNEYIVKYKGQSQYLDSIKNHFIIINVVFSAGMKSGIYEEDGIYKVHHTYENRPVAWVSWYGASVFCRFYGLQLPTEAQWENAARGGVLSPMNKNSSVSDNLFAGSNMVHKLGWYWDNSGKSTHASGSKTPNELGFYDMSGNLFEWCSDWYADEYYSESPTKNPQGPTSGTEKSFRGGSWFDDPESCRSAYRISIAPENRFNYIGFRVVYVK